jgi:[ribosomal protein S5]-alanine N-acetyltransferase
MKTVTMRLVIFMSPLERPSFHRDFWQRKRFAAGDKKGETHSPNPYHRRMGSLLLRTERLHLRSATPELAAADLNDPSDFSRLLEADVPQDWPPPLNDDNTKAFTLNYLKENPDTAGWAAWYFLLPGRAEEKTRAIGIGGFKGKPSREGMVEIGYSVMPGYQRRGFASEAVAGLIGWAFSHPQVLLVTAETLPALEASIRVLENNGFHLLGRGSEEGVIRYGIDRNQFQPNA